MQRRSLAKSSSLKFKDPNRRQSWRQQIAHLTCFHHSGLGCRVYSGSWLLLGTTGYYTGYYWVLLDAGLLAASVLPKAMNSPKADGLKRRHATRGLDHQSGPSCEAAKLGCVKPRSSEVKTNQKAGHRCSRRQLLPVASPVTTLWKCRIKCVRWPWLQGSNP